MKFEVERGDEIYMHDRADIPSRSSSTPWRVAEVRNDGVAQLKREVNGETKYRVVDFGVDAADGGGES